MIVSVSGLIGSGKDTIASYLINFHHFKKMSFASTLKDAAASVFSWDREMLEGSTASSREWREQRDDWWSSRLGMEITPRFVLQNWGTEVMRNHFHPEIWIASLENKLRECKDNVVITDARFFNELDAIKRSGGITMRVKRGLDPEWFKDAANANLGPKYIGWALGRDKLQKLKIHPSEYSSVGYEYDHIIQNAGTIDELYNEVEGIVSNASLALDHPDAKLRFAA
jgi:hypothetical protein